MTGAPKSSPSSGKHEKRMITLHFVPDELAKHSKETAGNSYTTEMVWG